MDAGCSVLKATNKIDQLQITDYKKTPVMGLFYMAEVAIRHANLHTYHQSNVLI